MTIIADRGLSIRILTGSGKLGPGEAEALADAMDGATKDPATKADLAEVRTEIALLRQTARADLNEVRAVLSQRIDALDRRLDERLDAQTNKIIVRLGGLVIAVAGVLFPAFRLMPH